MYELDDEEREIEEALERGAFKHVKGSTEKRRQAVDAANNFFKKDAKINIRLSSTDLQFIKKRAAEEGLPYQTLIASVLHKFAMGRLDNHLK